MRFLATFSRRTFLVALIVFWVVMGYYTESSAASLTITWTDNSDNEFGFKIERRQITNRTFNQIATVGPDINSYIDFSLNDGITYCYRVQAFNGSGASDYSNEDCTMAALVFQAITVSTTGSGGGTVTSTPGGISCGSDCTEDYEFSQVVTLTATPATGSVFVGWSEGDCSGTGSCTMALDSDMKITATFNLQIFNLTVTKSGSGDGTVTSAPTGITCGNDCKHEFEGGRVVTLNATQDVGSTFRGAHGGGCNVAATCVLTINGNITVATSFSKTFTDDPLTSNVTFVRAIHFTDTLEAINTLRIRSGLGKVNFTGPSPAPGVAMHATHITDLQVGLNAVYDALGRNRPTFDSIVPGATVIMKRQMDQVRSAIRALE